MNLIKFFGFVLLAFVIPFAVILGVYFDLLPTWITVATGTIGTLAAIAVIVGLTLHMMWSDVKTGRYAKK